MNDRAFLEALKALTIDSGDPLHPGTSSRETAESATARLDDLIRKFRETGIASSFPLGNETPKYGYNHLQSEPTDQDVPRYLPYIDLSGVAFSVLLQWYEIMGSGLRDKEGSLTPQEWHGMSHFRNACRDAMDRYNRDQACGEYRERRRRSASPSPQSRSPLRNQSLGPQEPQNDWGYSNVHSNTSYKWTEMSELNPAERYKANSIDVCDMPMDDQQKYVNRGAAEIEMIKRPILQSVEGESPDYRQVLDLKVGLHISAGFWTRQEGEALLKELPCDQGGLDRVEQMVRDSRLERRVGRMAL